MTNKEAQAVLDTVECEGFDYAFTHYSSFKEIKDEKFHNLRLAYKEAQQALEDYINDSV